MPSAGLHDVFRWEIALHMKLFSVIGGRVGGHLRGGGVCHPLISTMLFVGKKAVHI